MTTLAVAYLAAGLWLLPVGLRFRWAWRMLPVSLLLTVLGATFLAESLTS